MLQKGFFKGRIKWFHMYYLAADKEKENNSWVSLKNTSVKKIESKVKNESLSL